MNKQIITLLIAVQFLSLGLFSSIVNNGIKQDIEKIIKVKITKERFKRLKL